MFPVFSCKDLDLHRLTANKNMLLTFFYFLYIVDPLQEVLCGQHRAVRKWSFLKCYIGKMFQELFLISVFFKGGGGIIFIWLRNTTHLYIDWSFVPSFFRYSMHFYSVIFASVQWTLYCFHVSVTFHVIFIASSKFEFLNMHIVRAICLTS